MANHQLIKLTREERTHLKNLVDKKMGRITTNSDYIEAKPGVLDEINDALAVDLQESLISLSTLKRMLGLIPREMRDVHPQNIEVMARYLGYDDMEGLLKTLRMPHEAFEPEVVDFNGIARKHIIQIRFSKGRIIEIECVRYQHYRVIRVENMTLSAGDEFELPDLEVGRMLKCLNVVRGKEELGNYQSGSANMIECVALVRAVR